MFYLRRARRLLPALLVLLLAGRRVRGDLGAVRRAPSAAVPLAVDARLLGQLALHRRRHDVHGRHLRPVAVAPHLVTGDRGAVLHPVPPPRAGHRCDGALARRPVATGRSRWSRSSAWWSSAGWMAVLWGDGSDPSRGYFGTDTRVHSLLVGVLLGVVLVGRPVRRGRARAAWPPAQPSWVRSGWRGRSSSATKTPPSSSTGASCCVAVATAAIIAGSGARAAPAAPPHPASPRWHWASSPMACTSGTGP